MKTSYPFLVLAGLCSGAVLMAAEPPPAAPALLKGGATALTNGPTLRTNQQTQAQEAVPASTNAPPGEAADAAAASAAAATNSAPKISVEDGSDGIMFNFHGAPLSLVLESMSDAAGFIINNQAESLSGKVEIWSKKPVTKDEAVELLDSVLRKNRYAVTRNDRILTIISMDKAKTSSELGVRTATHWEDIEPTDEVGTWIIPVKYVSAAQLKVNLMVLLPLETELSVNESANSLVMVAPARDVRRALKIVNALDTSMSISASIKVFRLHYADAKQLATEIMTLFSQNTQGGMGGMGRAMMFMNMMRGGGGMGGGGQGASANPAGTKVAATSDDYSNSLIVNAAPEVMETIEAMVKDVDIATTDITEVKIFKLKHADANQLADQLSQLFPDTSRTDTGPGFGMRFGGGGPFGRGFGGNNQATSNTRDKKMSQVIAVPEPRTRSIMVSAAQQLMPHIAEMIAQLDVDARHEIVKVYDLANADPQDVQQILQDLFQRSGNIRANNNNRSSMLGTSNPLLQRETQNNQNTSSSSSSFGGNSRGGGGGGGSGMSF
ncbi:MAG: secretin N-terminal domain-containing protein [Limisphaerales bacterium]